MHRRPRCFRRTERNSAERDDDGEGGTAVLVLGPSCGTGSLAHAGVPFLSACEPAALGVVLQRALGQRVGAKPACARAPAREAPP